MIVVYDCKYCGKRIPSDMIFEGNYAYFNQWFQDKVDALSNECDCQKTK